MNDPNDPITRLQAWLERPVYTEGVLIYEQHFGQDDFMLRLFKTGVDDYNRDQLSQALTQKLVELEAQAKAVRSNYPDGLKAELQDGGLLMDERTLLKERMRARYNSGISDGEELKSMAYRILIIKNLLDGIYGRKNFFEQNGFLPGAASLLPEAETPAHLLRRRNSLRTYVCKYKQAVAQAYEPKKLRKAQAKLKGFQDELHQIDTHLKQFLPHE